jgi:hypothetical protein
VDRYEWAADRSGDELAVLVGVYRRARELICLDDCATAQRLEDARARLEDRLGRPEPPTLATCGNPHLKSGLAAARAGDCAGADAHLTEAVGAELVIHGGDLRRRHRPWRRSEGVPS